MQRKPGFPLANCNIKIPDAAPAHPEPVFEEDWERRRQQLINFGHQQWGFNNWSWSVTKQDLDFVDFVNGKHTAGVASFVSVTVKSLDIHRENVGYATTTAPMKGSAIYQARKGAVTNALRETLLSFGGAVASELLELLEASPAPAPAPALAEPLPENNQNIMNKLPEPKNVHSHLRKDDAVPVAPVGPHNVRPPAPPAPPAHAPAPPAPHPVKHAGKVAALPPAPRAAPPPPLAPPPRHNNVSFVMPMGYPPLFPPRPQFNYYEYAGPWHVTYDERPHNLNVNFNLPPKNKEPPAQPCWIKPTIFYDGFWTEQKVKKWVAEQVEKQFPEDATAPPAAAAPAAPEHRA